jgi:hypothetical protein
VSDIKNIRLNKVEVKLSDTNDPVALKISWDPLKPGGSNFKSQKMSVNKDSIVIEKSASAILFSLIFTVPGALGVFVGSPYFFLKGEIFGGIFMIIWGTLFGAAGVFLLKSDKKVTFDKKSGSYYRGKELIRISVNNIEQQGKLEDIYSIQLISERIQSSSSDGGSSNFRSYELNLIFKDGARVNVMDHGNAADIELSAKNLAKFLNIPIWKAEY